MSRVFAICVALAAVAVSATPAAASLQYILNQPSGGPYGTVTLTQISPTDVRVTVALEESPDAGFVETGSHQTFDFNLTGDPNVTITNLTAGFTVTGQNSGGSFTQSGFGTFEYSISCQPTCGNGASNPQDVNLVFDVNLASGITLTSFIANSSGFFFSADIFNGRTLPVGSNQLPEPMTLLIFGTGLAGAVGFRRWRKAAKPAA